MPIYMRITKKGLPVVTGDATAKGHERWIELSSVQMGQSRSIAPVGEASASLPSEMVITKSMDSASAALRQQSLNGERVTIQIDFLKSGGTYLTYTLQDALISTYQPGSATESLSLNFTKITFDTHGTGPDVSGLAGVLMRGWNASPGTRCIR